MTSMPQLGDNKAQTNSPHCVLPTADAGFREWEMWPLTQMRQVEGHLEQEKLEEQVGGMDWGQGVQHSQSTGSWEEQSGWRPELVDRLAKLDVILYPWKCH